MRKILLSIKPEYVKSILAGDKRYEFRKVRCHSVVDRIVIYATSPWKQVVGEVDVRGVIEDEPEIIWKQTAKYSGISKTFFDQYYEHANKAIAYQLGKVHRYPQSLSLHDFGVLAAPQSFVYLS